jgi:hypothetical protein
MKIKSKPAMKFLRVEESAGVLVAIVDFGGGEEEWKAYSLQQRLEGLIFDGYDYSEESRALKAIEHE